MTSACLACAGAARNPIQETGVTTKGDAPDVFVTRLRRDAVVFARNYPMPADRVWRVIPAVFRDLGFQGGPSEHAASRVYLTPELVIRQQLFTGEANSLYLDCGNTPTGRPAADEYVVRFAVLLRVRPVTADTSRVELLVDGRAHDRTQSSVTTMSCSGTGKLEESFMAQIGKRLPIGLPAR